MTDHYPLPANAAYIWLSGDAIMLGFPPTIGRKGHSIAIPLRSCGTAKSEECPTCLDRVCEPVNQAGWLTLLRVLQERATASREHLLIGHRAEPTQHQLDDILRAWGGEVKQLTKKPARADISLEDLGL